MGMPVITPGTSTRCQAVTDVISSVALEQTALSHILNAEGEKIQKIVQTATTAEEMLAVNRSVNGMVDSIARLEMLLQNKLNLFSDCLCEDCAAVTAPVAQATTPAPTPESAPIQA